MKRHLLVGMLHRMIDNAGTGHADVQNRFGLADAVKSAGHKGIILRRIAKHHQLCAAQAVPVRRFFRGFLNHLSHAAYRIHIDPGARGRGID